MWHGCTSVINVAHLSKVHEHLPAWQLLGMLAVWTCSAAQFLFPVIVAVLATSLSQHLWAGQAKQPEHLLWDLQQPVSQHSNHYCGCLQARQITGYKQVISTNSFFFINFFTLLLSYEQGSPSYLHMMPQVYTTQMFKFSLQLTVAQSEVLCITSSPNYSVC